MDELIVGRELHRAKMALLMAKLATSGIRVIGADEPVEFKIKKFGVDDLSIFTAKDFVIDPPNRPEVKRGKGKIKRW